MGMYGRNMNPSMYGSYGISPDQSKGKGKLKEADFEAAFAQAETSFAPVQRETGKIVEVDDSIADVGEASQNLTVGGDTKVDDRGQFKE
jgi:peroxin-5